ncbi:MAG: DUF433 domain-containing protein [Armatimonadetes bacterium]|nr:DUF433 domain-containing protein [Armatimonadota bacterium]
MKGTRISVEFLLELIASGASRSDIISTYLHLSAEDVDAGIRYAGIAQFDQNQSK